MDNFQPSEEIQFIWDFFDCSKTGFFVEVGANDPIKLSPTYYLEINGWSGILIEPQPDLAEQLEAKRKAKVWSVACGSPDDRGEAELFLLGEFSSLKKHVVFTDLVYSDSITVSVMTLDDILQAEGNPTIDFLSIDVEGTELNVLRGIDLKRVRPRLIFIEYHILSLDLHRFLLHHKYKLIRRTGVNSWYIPIDLDFNVPLLEKIKLFRKVYLGTPLRKMQFLLKKYTKHRKFRKQ